MFSKVGPEMARLWPNPGHQRPKLGRLQPNPAQLRTTFAKHRPEFRSKSAKLGQELAKLGRCWPNLGGVLPNSGQIRSRPRLARIDQSSSDVCPDLARTLPRMARNRPICGKLRPTRVHCTSVANFGWRGPTSDKHRGSAVSPPLFSPALRPRGMRRRCAVQARSGSRMWLARFCSGVLNQRLAAACMLGCMGPGARSCAESLLPHAGKVRQRATPPSVARGLGDVCRPSRRPQPTSAGWSRPLAGIPEQPLSLLILRLFPQRPLMTTRTTTTHSDCVATSGPLRSSPGSPSAAFRDARRALVRQLPCNVTLCAIIGVSRAAGTRKRHHPKIWCAQGKDSLEAMRWPPWAEHEDCAIEELSGSICALPRNSANYGPRVLPSLGGFNRLWPSLGQSWPGFEGT